MELTTRQIQLESLKILKVIDDVARKEGLRYGLFFGTLLGAIRHNGFIPWDDDLDIYMFRNDYEKLKSYFIAHKNELCPLEFFAPETKADYPYLLGRITNSSFKMLAEGENDYGMGTFVDVYPIDGAGNGKHRLLYYRTCLYCTLYALKSKTHFIKPFGKIKTFFKRILFFVSRLCSYESLRKKLRNIANKFPLESSEYVACLLWMDGGKPQIFKKNDLAETVLVDFEGAKFPVPKNYDTVLKKLYGEYMKLPPENERIGHHYYKIFPKCEATK